MLIRTRTSLLLACIALLAACGGDEFATSEAADASAGSAGASGAAGSSGKAGSAGQAGAAGKAGQGGSIPEAGPPDVVVVDAAAGAAGAPIDAAPDADPLGSCLFSSFSFTPPNPVPPAFQVHYKNSEDFICVRFEVQCEGGPATISNTKVSEACEIGTAHCWQADVTNCQGNYAEVKFFKDSDNPADPTCHGLFAGKPGEYVKGCGLPLAPVP